METTFKKLLYAGIGLATEAGDRIEKKIDELSKKGESSDTRTRRLVDELIKNTEEASSKAEKAFNEVVEKFGYAKKSEITELRKKLETLEAMAAEKNKTANGVKAK